MTACIWQGLPADGVLRLYVRPDQDGTLSAVVGGREIIGETVALSAGNDRVGRIDIPVSSRTRQTVSVRNNGVEIGTASVRALPRPGESFKVLFLSCQYTIYPWLWDDVIERLDPDLIVVQGDGPYSEQPDNANTLATGNHLICYGEDVQGISSVAANDTARRECIWAHHRQFRRMLLRVLSRRPSTWTLSDHDGFTANDWDRTVAKANAYAAGLFADLAAVDAFADLVYASHRPYYQGNPPNYDSGRDLSLDPTAQWYFRAQIGPWELFCTDHYKYQNRGGDSPRYTMGGQSSQQETWLFDRLRLSEAPLKMWSISNGAPWLSGALADEGTRCLDYIGNPHKSGWRRPGGAFTGHGDIHDPYMQFDDAAKGHSRTLLRVNASPCGTGFNPSWNPAAAGENTVYSAIKSTGQPGGFYFNVGLVEVDGAGRYQDVHLIDPYGNKRNSKRIYAGSNRAYPIAVMA